MVSQVWMPALVIASSLLTLDLAAAQTAREPRFKLDGSGTRVIEVSNLPSDGCPASNSVGRITKRHMENGKLVAVGFKDRRSDEYINLPDASEFRSRASYDRVRTALDAMLTPGAEVRVRLAACGAGGAVVALESIALISVPQSQGMPNIRSDEQARAPQAYPDNNKAGSDIDPLRSQPGGSRAPLPAARTVAAPAPSITLPDIDPPEGSQNGKDGWRVQGDATFTSMGLVSGMHYHTFQLTCRHPAGLVEVVIDDPKARYGAGSRQSFTLSAGAERATIQGTSLYDDMDDVRQISAKVPASALLPVLSAMASGDRLSIITRAGRQALPRAESAKKATAFLSRCAPNQ